MYRSIQVRDFDFSKFPTIKDLEVDLYKIRNEDKLINIQNYLLNEDNVLSVEKIAKHLFIDVKPHIFLSHSHKDEDSVIRLAVLIKKKLGLDVFIDSCVWGNAYSLLYEIDKEYCYKKVSNTFEYERRNHTTANVFMILNAALHRIIDNCEAFIFLGTDNSISITDAINDQKYLSSPWIYSELQFASQVERKVPRQPAMESRDTTFADSIGLDESKKIEFAYDVPETDATLSNENLLKWLNTSNRLSNESLNHPLDDLYRLMTYRKRKVPIYNQIL